MAYRFVLPFADVGIGISPSTGAKLEFFNVGTSTQKDTFSDFALTIKNSNPVVAGPNGLFGDIFLGTSADVTLDDGNTPSVQKWGPETVYPPLDTITANDVAKLIFDKNTEEDAANATIVDFTKPPLNVLRYQKNTTPGVTDMGAGFDTLWDVAKQQTQVSITIPPEHYLLSAISNCDFLADTTVLAYGAKFTATHNGILFDINPVATAAIPITVTADTFTKRRVKWLGGNFENTNATKTASIAVQAYMMRDFQWEPEHVEGFFTGCEFAGKDTYKFLNGFAFNCERALHVPAAGTVYTATLTANDLINVTVRNWHFSIGGKPYGIFFENRIINFSQSGGSMNGVATIAHVSLSDNATAASEGVSFSGVHFEQMGASLPAVVFNATGTQGFHSVSVDDACHFQSGTAGWYGITLDKCLGVEIGTSTFRDGSGGSTERCIFVDSDSRDIGVSAAVQFLNIAAGQAIVLEAAIDRRNISIFPTIVKSETPDVLTNFNGNAFSDATTSVDMSAEFTDWANFLLPPKGYEVTLTSRDSGSAAAGTDAVEAKLGKPSAAANTPIAVWLSAVPDDNRRSTGGYVPADDNGDLELITDATGASTMDVWIGINAVHQ